MIAGIEVTEGHSESLGFRVRLRFRVFKSLSTHDLEQTLLVDGHEVRLTSAAKGEKLSDAKWLVMNARHFPSEREARDFGTKLKGAVQLSAIYSRQGVDCGTDAATLALGDEYREHLLHTSGRIFRDNIHGLDVFADDPNISFLSMSAHGSVLVQPQPFFEGIERFHSAMGAVGQEVSDILLLLNFALMNPEPVAQIVFAVSAVEMIGQRDSSWSKEQKALIKRLGSLARADTSLSAEDADKVAEAVERVHRVSLRQGVMGLLHELGLSYLRAEWDQLYGERSTLVHGLAPKPGVRYDDLANRTVSLCGHILMKVIAREIQGADSANLFYPVSTQSPSET
jgi:hypothetical protein